MSTLKYISTSPFLAAKLEDRTAQIGVIGLGYVGLPLVLLFSEQKFRVTGFDIDQKKVDTVQQGGSYIVRIIVTDHSSYDYAAIVKEANLVIDTRNATKGIQNPKIVRC